MGYYIKLAFCLLFLTCSTIALFYSKQLSKKVAINKKAKFENILKTTGFVVCLASLILIYFLK